MSDFKLVKLIDPINNTIITGGLNPTGEYNGATDYAVGDSVEYNGTSYVMFLDAPTGTLPTNSTYWQVLAEKGDVGVQGVQGEAGEGVEAGGTTGQQLVKASDTDYDTEWVDPGSGSGDMTKAVYDPAGINEQLVGETEFDLHANDLTNPHSVTATQVGLGNVDNTSDLDKPISTDTQTALDLKTDDVDYQAHIIDKTTHGTTSDIVGIDDIQTLTNKTIDGNENTITNIEASDVAISQIGTPTVTHVQDMIDEVGSAGAFTNGGFTDNLDGTIEVSSGSGVIRKVDDDSAPIFSFDWSTNISVSLTDNSDNYIYVDYNAGSPIIASATTSPSDHNTKILLGMVYREGNDLTMVDGGQRVSNSFTKMFFKDIEIGGKFQRASGMVISETGTRNIALTAGSFYAGMTKTSLGAFDSSGVDTFNYYYRDGIGGHTKVASQTQTDNTQYDNGSGALATLGFNRYGVHWVYEDVDGGVAVVYGTDSYTLSEAQDEGTPSDIPDFLSSMAGVVGKIIIKKNATSFTSIQSSFDVVFSPSAVTDHNNLSNIQGGAVDDYFHLTEDETIDLAANTTHRGQTDNPHTVTATHVGLGNVTDTSDVDKPVSTAQQTALDLKEDKINKDSANGYAGLDASSKINPSQLPALAISETFVVASEIAQFALTVQEGDVAVRTDENISYIALNDTNASMSDWQELLTPTDAVQSVFGRSGVVTAQNGDYTKDQVGLANVDNTADADKPISTAGATKNTSQDGFISTNNAKETNIAHPLVEKAVPSDAVFTDTIYDDTAIQAEVDLNTAKIGVTDEISDVIEDTTPQLGGDLDANGKAIVAADHGTATDDEVVNVCYGTSATPPLASTTTEGTLYIQYTA